MVLGQQSWDSSLGTVQSWDSGPVTAVLGQQSWDSVVLG